MLWKLKDLVESAQTCQTERQGEWMPCRPINYTCDTPLARLKHAWMVFTGKAEAVVWPGGQ